ncbi:hypothetical protein ABMA79_12095 [Halobacteriovorax sp. HFRX-2_2]|uniref:hypothetical protein n=1 Tax=unclassified Halobacteriovorax TaxID=2639665 RepID=UPI00371241C0
MKQLRSLSGRISQASTPLIDNTKPTYDEYDMIVLSSGANQSEYAHKHTNDDVIHKTLMIKSKYITWAYDLVASKVTRKKPGLGTILKALVEQYDKELSRKKRLLTKLRNLFDLIIDDTELLISNKKHGRISQAQYYQDRVLKGRHIFKRLHFEFMFDEDDLLEAFTKKELAQINTWVISPKENLLEALESWSKSYKHTVDKGSFQ